MHPDVEALRAALPTLTARNAEFANDLIRQAAKPRGLSEKQMYWVRKLATPQPAPQAPAQTTGLEAIVALLRRARASLKRPQITFATATGEKFRLSIAGERARVPGSVNVTSAESDFDGRDWFGRIHVDGRYEAALKFYDRAESIGSALTAFAVDPAGQAAAYGRRFGACCFCNRTLVQPVSVAVGYGPVCADRHGLPYGAPAAPRARIRTRRLDVL